ncbi:HNH endonuclease [Thermostilla marina]
MPTGILQRPTLVLNRNWQPIHIATVARALVLVYQGTALVVDPDDYQTYTWRDWARLVPEDDDLFVQGVAWRIRVPEVVTLVTYDRVPHSSVPFSRRNLFRRDGYTCQYCGRKLSSEQLTIDHVIPRCQGGESTWENCVLACVPCNRRKAARTPEQAGMRLRKKPVRPRWTPLYSAGEIRVESWRRFLSEVYWNVTLDR